MHHNSTGHSTDLCCHVNNCKRSAAACPIIVLETMADATAELSVTIRKRRVAVGERVTRKKQKAAGQCTVPFLYGKFLYFQEMKTANHLLRQGRPNRVKERGRDQWSDVARVARQVTMDVTYEMFYGFKGLSKTPHGGALRNELGTQKGSVPSHHICYESVLNKTHDVVRVAYPGSDILRRFTEAEIDKQMLLEMALDKGEACHIRDDVGAATDNGGRASRLTIGFTRPQPGTNPNQKYVYGVPLPFLHKSKIREIPKPARAQLGVVMTLAKSCLADLYSDLTFTPFSDLYRNVFFARRLARAVSPTCDADFEFVDIFAETGCILKRHMDYMNDDETRRYMVGASYSFLIRHEGRMYRVSIIMASRKVCGAAMKRIHENSI